MQPSSGLRESRLGVFKATVKVVVAMSRVLGAKLRILGPNVKALETKALARFADLQILSRFWIYSPYSTTQFKAGLVHTVLLKPKLLRYPINGRTEEWTDVQTEGRTDRQTDRRLGGRTDGRRSVGRTDKSQTCLSKPIIMVSGFKQILSRFWIYSPNRSKRFKANLKQV